MFQKRIENRPGSKSARLATTESVSVIMAIYAATTRNCFVFGSRSILPTWPAS
jgi:hypothetical protein